MDFFLFFEVSYSPCTWWLGRQSSFRCLLLPEPESEYVIFFSLMWQKKGRNRRKKRIGIFWVFVASQNSYQTCLRSWIPLSWSWWSPPQSRRWSPSRCRGSRCLRCPRSHSRDFACGQSKHKIKWRKSSWIEGVITQVITFLRARCLRLVWT